MSNPHVVRTARFCRIAESKQRSIPSGLSANHVKLIRTLSDKWVNGTTLRYCFVDRGKFKLQDGTWSDFSWKIPEDDARVVRQAFDIWKSIGIGLNFQEVGDRKIADIRIGFLRGDGAWSYIGRQIRDIGPDEITMNFGWDISNEIDTAIHEIGHTIGFPHEHQNPNAGITWDEEAVYNSLAAPPNNWDRATTYHNIIRKILPDSVQGSNWDPNSIMHYPFEPGLIKEPEQYRSGLYPEPGLSNRDKEWVRTFYPPLDDSKSEYLERYKSISFSIGAGQQVNYKLKPETTHQAKIQTFGESDTVIVLFEQTPNGPIFIAGDDDSGLSSNALLNVPLIVGREYILRIRLYNSTSQGTTSIMYH